MSRSGYSDDCDNLELYRANVDRASKGKRGQKFFVDLLVALDAMPDKSLIANDLEKDGEVCAIGSLGAARGVDMKVLDPHDSKSVGSAFDIATCLAQEVVFMNDEWGPRYESSHDRWARMHRWVTKQIKKQESNPKLEHAQ